MGSSEQPISNVLMDMDGVLVRGRTVIAGAAEFLERLKSNATEYLVLTNNPLYTPGDLAHRLKTEGLDIPAERIFTSAMATALFLKTQSSGGTAFVIGESGLTSAIHGIGYVITDRNPDYVVLGETQSYSLETMTKAIRLVAGGAHFIATDPDPSGPSEGGIVPACGAVAALIESASGASPFYVGKPNPLMMRMALNYLGAHSEESVMIGDRMDTDVVAGVNAGMRTILVLTGVTKREDVTRYPYQPTFIAESIGSIDLEDLLHVDAD